MKVIKENKYKVSAYFDKDGNKTADKNLATVMVAIGIKGNMIGVSMPFSIKELRDLNLKIGSVFREALTFERIS